MSLAKEVVKALLERERLAVRLERVIAERIDEKNTWRARAEEAERTLRGQKTSAEAMQEAFDDALKEQQQ